MNKSYIKTNRRHINQSIAFTVLLILFLLVFLLESELILNNLYNTLIITISFVIFFSIYKIISNLTLQKKITKNFELVADGDFINSSLGNLQFYEFEMILELLKNSRGELRQIIDLVPHNLFAKDSDGKYLFVNKATASSFGLLPEEVEGYNHMDIFKSSNIYDSEEAEAFLEDDLEVISNNRTKFTPEEIIHYKDGTERIMQTTKIPFRTHFSKKPAMFGISIDITEEKEINKKLDSHQRILENNFEKLKEHTTEIDTLNRELEEFQKEIVQIMIKMLEIHDKYTKGHSENVAELGKLIAKEMGLSDKIIHQTYWAGILHDIGKTVVPKNILNKKTSLNDEEFEYIKNHSLWGHSVLKSSKQLSEIANFVLYHHEKWDSSGYPVGLEEDEIPLVSQILSIADAWDAMTSKRSYRDPMPKDVALNEILKNSGKQFNPKIVNIFEKLQKSGDIDKIFIN